MGEKERREEAMWQEEGREEMGGNGTKEIGGGIGAPKHNQHGH